MEQRKFAKRLRSNMTDAEQILWRQLRAHRLNGEKFRRQQPMGSYVLDFVHFGARVVVEADGGQHNESTEDAQRDAWLQQQGFQVLRFWNNEILCNIEGVMTVIFNALASVDSAPSPLAPLPQGARGTKE